MMLSSIYKASIVLYIVKCIVGFSICYALYLAFPQHQFYWSMLSVLLVISPEEDLSHRLAFDRMKANLLGSTVGIVVFLGHVPALVGMCLGIVIVIAAGMMLNISNATRSALASLVIVLMHEQQESSWNIAVERMLCVIAGCVIAIAVTYIAGFVFRGGSKGG